MPAHISSSDPVLKLISSEESSKDNTSKPHFLPRILQSLFTIAIINRCRFLLVWFMYRSLYFCVYLPNTFHSVLHIRHLIQLLNECMNSFMAWIFKNYSSFIFKLYSVWVQNQYNVSGCFQLLKQLKIYSHFKFISKIKNYYKY